ncbi:aldo/keto reductase [Oceanirhabdus sp. W0125-5]|uniref:aldo/keto reductase n=1 Tax=Oceanirhabdus sp. W0125-5 TaxID=2999116 RepID=UPI0022F2B262|nr:aldo/keto reductase [Oceanirhabdus sp. W0125-5]WBW95114.1 aldo/keto reductase [Oceanirhabdus sp. W0125-5]
MDKMNIVLNNGIEMPLLGFGTFKIEDGEQVKAAVKEALNAGYRHIDTAAVYGNETGVGAGIMESGVEREEIFLVSKVWNSDQGYEETKKAFQESLDKLKTDYLDLYLIHWPKELNKETWRAMEELYEEGKIKAIGISNFKPHHIKELMETAKVIPTVNQVEFHPQFIQEKTIDFCNEHNIKTIAWGPLMQGDIFKIPLMKEIAEKYKKSIAQVTLRWAYQMGVATVSKSINPERIRNNFDILNFEISKEDMARIAELNTGERIGPDPDKIDF